LTISLFALAGLHGQETPAGYLEEIGNDLTLSGRYLHRYSYLRITSRLNQEAPPVIYVPNVGGAIGATVKYKWLSLGYTFKLPRHNDLGNTKYTDLTLGIQGRRYSLWFYYLRYRSLYIRNFEATGGLSPGSTPLRPDMRVTTTGLLSTYSFRKNFSIKAAFAQTERQLKSAGSFLLIMGDRFSSLTNDSSFIPLSLEEDFDITHTLSDIRTNTLTVAPGGGYTFVLSRYLTFTSILYLGWGIQMRFYEQEQTHKFNIRLPFFLKSMSALGYNGEKFFGRLVYDLERNDIRFNDSNFSFFSSFFQVSIGIRFFE